MTDLQAALRSYWKKVQGKEPTKTFAPKMSLSPSAVYQIRKGRKNVTVEHLAQLADLQGKTAPMVLNDVLQAALSPDLEEAPHRPWRPAERAPRPPRRAPYYARFLGRIAAGQPIEAIRQHDDIDLPDDPVEAELPRTRPADPQAWVLENLFALEVQGESMAGNNLHDRDVIVARRETTTDPTTQDIYVVLRTRSNQAALKRVKKREGMLRLLSSNVDQRAYPPIDADDAVIQGRFLAVIRRAKERC